MHDDFYQMYLEELEEIAVLEPAEEEACLKRLAEGDSSVKKRLIEGNLKKVLAYAREYEGQGVVMNDLVQEANMALMMAVEGFSGGDFYGRLEEMVRKALEYAVEEQRQEKNVQEELTARVNVLQQISSLMAKELGREATLKELAEKMKMTEEEIKDIMKTTLDAVHVSQAGGYEKG
ncbi:sigma-70 domain-containing protein [Lachnospiraceae bacterium 62-35]